MRQGLRWLKQAPDHRGKAHPYHPGLQLTPVTQLHFILKGLQFTPAVYVEELAIQKRASGTTRHCPQPRYPLLTWIHSDGNWARCGRGSHTGGDSLRSDKARERGGRFTQRLPSHSKSLLLYSKCTRKLHAWFKKEHGRLRWPYSDYSLRALLRLTWWAGCRRPCRLWLRCWGQTAPDSGAREV